MLKLFFRSTYQTSVMIAIVLVAALTGWGCGCLYGSDHKQSAYPSRQQLLAEGVVERYHDFGAQETQVTVKDLSYLRDHLQNGGGGIGLLVPQAPGADQPGSLDPGSPAKIYLYPMVDGQWRNIDVPLQQDTALEAELNTLFPPPQGTRWQALAVKDFAWMDQLPTGDSKIALQGSLYYVVDFHGADYCSYCEIKLTACSKKVFSFAEMAVLNTMTNDQMVQGSGLTCAKPLPTTIMITDQAGAPQPGPLTASLGLWGGQVYVTATQPSVTIDYTLIHTSDSPQMMNLALTSDQGWTYQFTDLSGTPLTQIEVGALKTPVWENFAANLRVVGSGLPTCTRQIDTIHLTATMVSNPSIQATADTQVQVLPDPATCQVADVGVTQASSGAEVQAGQAVTFTLTVTNYESSALDVVVTDTLSPAEAVGEVTLPGNCTRSGVTIQCQVNGLGANASLELPIQVQSSLSFTGTLINQAQAEPAQGSDARFYDNAATPAQVVVSGGTGERKLYLPLTLIQ